MPPPADDPVPVELAYRLRPAEPVLWWGRPGGLAFRPRHDVAMWPAIAVAAAAGLVIVGVPGPAWQPAVTTIFRIAIASWAVSLILTFLTIVVRQRRQRIYAITRDRVLSLGDYWAGGTRAWPLAQIREVRVEGLATQRGSRAEEGTIWFGVAEAPATDGLFPPAPGEPARPRLERVRGAGAVATILVAAADGGRARRDGRPQV